MKCRFCNNQLRHEFIDLINAPPSNSFLKEKQLNEPEIFYPLRLFICDQCFLLQIDEYKKADEIFSENYIYLSSYTKSWLDHAKKYVDMITEKLKLDNNSRVIEIASNDGYLLQYFLKKDIPVLGIEPTSSTARLAIQKGIETIEEFFGETLAIELKNKNIKADLIVGNNVMAHVPDINDFIKGLKIILKEDGVITIEFPHLLRLIEDCLFDTIYHEHFSYFSFITVKKIFEFHSLEIFDVDEIPTQGGSLRIYAKHIENKTRSISPNVTGLIKKEILNGLDRIEYYMNFQKKVDKIKYDLLKFLIERKENGKNIIAYGAAAKGNTLLNYCGIKKDLIDYVVDRSPYKQGKFLPGNHIPVVKEIEIKKTRPEFILILPWNIKEEIMEQLKYIKEWDGQFIIPIPELEIK